jgi:hypothetical protein
MAGAAIAAPPPSTAAFNRDLRFMGLAATVNSSLIR